LINIQVETQLDKSLGNLIRDLTFKKPLKNSVELLKKETQQNFDQQGRIYGTWRPLAKSTRIQRSRLGYGAARPILVRTGRLKKGFVTSSTDKKAEISNTAKYAAVHQYGRGRIPQRKILDVSAKSEKAIGLIFANFIGEKIKKYL